MTEVFNFSWLTYLHLHAPLQAAVGNGMWIGERVAYIIAVTYALAFVPGIPPHLRLCISRTRVVAFLAILHRGYWNVGIFLRDREGSAAYWVWTEQNKWITLLISSAIAIMGYWCLRPLLDDAHADTARWLWFGTITVFGSLSGLLAV